VSAATAVSYTAIVGVCLLDAVAHSYNESTRNFQQVLPHRDAWQALLYGCRVSAYAPLLARLYACPALRNTVYRLALRLEGGRFYSATAREILRRYHGVTVGAYSYGPVLVPGRFPPGVTLGRFVSIGPDVHVFLRNHPTDRLSTHPFFFNARLSQVPTDNVALGSLRIGHDAWIGARAVITRGCQEIGMGAVVGAGSVVTRPVPPFTIVAGVPARVIRQRFADSVISDLLASRWWERSIQELRGNLDMFTRSVDESVRERLRSMGLRSAW